VNLNLTNPSLELVRELIAHDKWKTQEQHRHEKEMLLLGRSLGGHSETDTFNEETSGGECSPKQHGLISRADVRRGAKRYTETLPGVSDPDMYADLLMVSWCGKRLERWPTARDSKTAIAEVKKCFESLVKSKGGAEVLEAVALVPDFDARIVQEQIDALQGEEKARIVNSPLFAEFHKSYPHVDLHFLEKMYESSRENFVEAGIKVLRRKFPEHPPDEFSDHPTWQQSCHQHLPKYLEQWKKDLRSMQNRMRVAQRAWAVSTS
jgi:hypothetical protein